MLTSRAVLETCPSEDVLIDFAAARSATDERAAVEAHLAGCERCRVAVSALLGEGDRAGPGETLAQLSLGSNPTPPASPKTEGDCVGRTFGDFTLKARLGGGGGGEVYLAEQLTLGREAVVKVLAKQNELSAAAAERFLREAQLASRIDHPFAAHVYAFGVEPDATLWIAMELIRGTSLQQLLEARGALPLARFVPLLDRLSEVLNAAHEQGIVHRDIKPANIMVLQRAGRLLPKLLDLGIARVVDAGHGIAPEPLGGGDLGSRSPESLQLTQLGALVGTPHFMAPEQWVDASSADARSDVYSLAILTYQCLTGRLPFVATTVRDMAVAHATQALPPLEAPLPPALFAVLQKGAAKNPNDRYATALGFAAAVRDASGLSVEPPPLPQLAEGLRENVQSEAPQPIAEAAAMLERASGAKQALEAAATLATVLCRYLGLLALAARTKVGPGAPSDSPAVTAALERLHRDGLSDEAWLSLASALVRPFAARPDAHPLPELVRFFAPDARSGSTVLGEAVALASNPRDVADRDTVGRLERVVPALGSALERASFVFDHSLVVQRREPERWVGTRHPTRLRHPTVGRLPPGAVVLVDAVGTVVLTLSPLMQCSAPSGGAPDELFMLEGPGRHGARLVALPAPFERQDETLWRTLVDQGVLPAAAHERVTHEAAPYKGLAPFSTDDADHYFGREKEAEAFANRLRAEAFLAVVGPSGTGKSSFVLAGVLPLLPPTWRAVVFRPGPGPLSALKQALARVGLPSPEADLPGLVRAMGPDETLVLVVDQFEELVTLCQDVAARHAFATVLLGAAHEPQGRVKVVATLRDDFLIAVQQLPAFRDTLSHTLQLLGTPALEELERVVAEPAKRVGYTFDDPTLPARMVAAVAQSPGALAMLSFTASQLWELRDRHLRLMRLKTYDALGGVGGALANHAEATLAALSNDEQKLVREIFRHLVTAQGTRAVLSKKEALELLGGGPAAQRVLEQLVGARLVVSSEAVAGDDTVEMIHEALITAWPRLVEWQRADAEAARLKDALRASARQWQERGRPKGLLWRQEALAEYRLWRARYTGRLTQLEDAFAHASLQDEARAVRLRRGLTAAAFAVLTVGLLVLYQSREQAVQSGAQALRSAQEAHQRLTDMRVEQARLASLEGKPFQAAAYLAAARGLGAQGPLVEHLERAVSAKLSGELGHATLEGPRTLVASPSGTRLVALNPRGGATVLSLPDLASREQWADQGPFSSAFVFAGDDRHGFVCNRDGAVMAWAEGQPLRQVGSASGRLLGCAYSPKHHLLLGLVRGASLVRWRVTDAQALGEATTAALDAPSVQVRLSESQDLAVTFGSTALGVQAARVAVVSVPSLQRVALVETGHENDTSVDLLEAQGLLAAASVDGRVRLIDVKTSKVRTTLRGHSGAINAVAFSPDGQALATSSDDGSARVWNLNGEIDETFVHPSAVKSGQFVDGDHLVTTTQDGVVSVWRRGVAEPVRRFFSHLTPLSTATLPDGQLLSTGDDGVIRRWNVKAGATRVEPLSHDLSFVVVSPDRRQAFVGPDGGRVTWLSLPGFERLGEAVIADCDAAGTLSASFGPTPRVATAAGNTWCVLDWQTHAVRRGDAQAPIKDVRLSPDGEWLAVALPKEVVLSNARTGAEVHRWPADHIFSSLAFAEMGVLAGTNEGTIERYELAQPEAPPRSFRAHQGAVLSIRVAPSGLIVSTSDDFTVAVSDPGGRVLKRLLGHRHVVAAAELSPDERLVASVDTNGAILVWDFGRAQPIAAAAAGGPANDVAWLSPTQLITELGTSRQVEAVEILSDAALSSGPLRLSDDGLLVRSTTNN